MLQPQFAHLLKQATSADLARHAHAPYEYCKENFCNLVLRSVRPIALR